MDDLSPFRNFEKADVGLSIVVPAFNEVIELCCFGLVCFISEYISTFPCYYLYIVGIAHNKYAGFNY